MSATSNTPDEYEPPNTTCRMCGDPTWWTVHTADGSPRYLKTCHCGWINLESYAPAAKVGAVT